MNEGERPAPTAEADALLLCFLKTGEAACPLCDYSLRGASTGRCPECGAALQLTVAPAGQAPWQVDRYRLGALMGFAWAFVTGGGAVLWQLWFWWQHNAPFDLVYGVPFAIMAASGAAGLALVMLGQRRRWPARRFRPLLRGAVALLALEVLIQVFFLLLPF